MRHISMTANLLNPLPPIEDIVDELPKTMPWEQLSKKYIHKGVWDKTYHTGFRKPEDIDTIVVHHSGPPNGTLESHARYHARKWGAGIAYHLCIDKGRVFQVNNLLSFTFHVGNHNTYTVGIEINRDLTSSPMTSQERELLYGAILTVKGLLPIKHILGHNELNATACPCTSMSQIRKDILEIENEIDYRKSVAYDNELASKVMARTTDIYRKSIDPTHKYNAAARGKIRKMAQSMEKDGLFNPVDMASISHN